MKPYYFLYDVITTLLLFAKKVRKHEKTTSEKKCSVCIRCLQHSCRWHCVQVVTPFFYNMRRVCNW